jgi:hypothetical protein
MRIRIRVRRYIHFFFTIISSACFARCRFTHDIPAYLAQKPRDIHFPHATNISTEPPFVSLPSILAEEETPNGPERSLDPTTFCAVFAETGACRHGFKCRFLGAHVTKGEDGLLALLTDEGRQAATAFTSLELNTLASDTLKAIRTKKVLLWLESQPCLLIFVLYSFLVHYRMHTFVKSRIATHGIKYRKRRLK